MYWTDSYTDKIQRANLNGSRIEDLVTGLDRPQRIALDISGGKVYWTDTGTDKIQRANLNGSRVEDLVTGLGNPRGIALDIAGRKMYWADSGTDKIQRANLNGSGIQDLVTGIDIGGDDIELDVSGGKMYWADNNYDQIQRANLDGSQIEVLVTGGYPLGVALAIIQEEVVNRAPLAVGTISAQTLTVGGSAASVNVSAHFRDPDNDNLTYTATSDNTRAATVSVSGAVVTITPKSAGSATVTVTASDSTLTATQTFAVTVEAAARANRAPLAVGSISNQTLTVGGSDATLNVSSNFQDPDNDSLTYTATSDNTAVATVSVSGALVIITPQSVGSATVTVTASDGTLTTAQTFAVTVEASARANRAPLAVGSISKQTLTVGGSDATLNVSSNFQDPDNDNLTYTATSDNTAVATVSVSGAVVTITPKSAGSATVTVTASDSTLTTAQTFAVTVEASARANRAPLAVGSISKQTLTVGGSDATLNVSSNFQDPDNDNLTYTATSDNTAVATVSVSGAVVTIAPKSTGSATVTVTASDSTLTATQTLAVTVDAAPRVAHTLVKISGDNQQGPPGETLLSPIVVEVQDAENRGLGGVDVTFTVTAGGGSLSERTVTTDANGQASSRLTLGNNEGENTVSVSAEGISETVNFTALGANEVNIPDPNLRAKIERTLNKRAGDPITAAEMATLTRLDASNSYISDLTGLKFAINLTWLNLYNSEIYTLPTGVFGGLSKVTSLTLTSNPLTTIKTGAFNGLSSLTTLDLRNMYVKTIEERAFNGLSNLTELNLYNNEIYTLPTGVFEGLSKVASLTLTSNPLTTIKTGAFNGLSSLTTLDLRNMYVKTIEERAFNGLSNLQSLNLYNNEIYTLPTGVFEGLSKVASLTLTSNPLTTIKTGAFNGLSSLTTLDLRNMYVKTIEERAFNGLANLQSLNLYNNSINTLQTGMFEGLTSLISLNLNSNPGTRFTLVLELARTDTTDPAAPGPATVVIKLVQGAPFEMTVNLSVEGGTLSATTATIARGEIQSEPITMTQSGTRPATVSLETVPRVPRGYSGIRMAVGDSLSTGSISPHALVKISGDNQQGPAGGTLENPLIVEVRDATDRGLRGVDVTFAVTAGDGSLSDTTVTTGPTGQAESWFTLGRQPGTHTVQASVEGLSQTAVFNATIESMEFDFSVPSGINLIHVPLRVTAVDGVAQSIESISDLYNALGGASTVNFLLTPDPATQGWLSYFGTFDTGRAADTALTDDTGILAGMRVPVSVRLRGNALGINRSSTITLNQGLNLVGLPLRDSRITRVSALFAIDGIGGNVPVVILTDSGGFKAVGQVGDPGDVPITGGQAFILTAQESATIAISGEGWTNTSRTTAAPPMALTGIKAGDTTPVLGLRGEIVDEDLKVEGFRVIVKTFQQAEQSPVRPEMKGLVIDSLSLT